MQKEFSPRQFGGPVRSAPVAKKPRASAPATFPFTLLEASPLSTVSSRNSTGAFYTKKPAGLACRSKISRCSEMT